MRVVSLPFVESRVPNTSPDPQRFPTTASAFLGGLKGAATSILTYTLFATYIGIGALAHDLNYTLTWTVVGTLTIWAAPAQIILLTTLGGGGTVVQAAIAVTISAIRLMPMVVTLLPLVRERDTPSRSLLSIAHFTAITLWVESLRLLPHVPRPRRVAFVNGLGVGLLGSSSVATAVGYLLAASLPPLLATAVLFLTPMTFLVSTARNSPHLADRIALVLGLILTPIVALAQTGVDILIAGTLAGSIGYAVYRLRRKPG